jgi:transcriptional regulator with XRE-family HTH domain
MDIREVFALNLRRARKAKGLSQEALTHEADVDRTYVSALERSEYSATIDMVDKLAKALARISHRIECIGAANQRKVLCHKHFSPNRGAPRCRQSVFRICLDLNRLKDAMWWRRLTPA